MIGTSGEEELLVNVRESEANDNSMRNYSYCNIENGNTYKTHSWAGFNVFAMCRFLRVFGNFMFFVVVGLVSISAYSGTEQ